MECQQYDYSYALNQENSIINIRFANRQDLYTCPSCGGVMIPHMGEIRKWHFTHKSNTQCCYETYLHQVTKKRVREAFMNAENFYISFDTYKVCSADCLIKRACGLESTETFDIRQYYDTCEEEQQYAGFRPDLILKSLLHPERPPIFIEIKVTHKSSVDKLSSGIRIIEIAVEKYDDIDDIINNHCIRGHKVQPYSNELERYKISLYNFDKAYYLKPSDKFCHFLKYVFALRDDGHFEESKYKCFENIDENFPSNEFNLIVSDTPIDKLWAFFEFQRRGLNITSCFRCKFSRNTENGESLCALYLKCDTPKFPDFNYAKSCSYYKLATENAVEIPIDNLSPSSIYKVIMRK